MTYETIKRVTTYALLDRRPPVFYRFPVSLRLWASKNDRTSPFCNMSPCYHDDAGNARIHIAWYCFLCQTTLFEEQTYVALQTALQTRMLFTRTELETATELLNPQSEFARRHAQIRETRLVAGRSWRHPSAQATSSVPANSNCPQLAHCHRMPTRRFCSPAVSSSPITNFGPARSLSPVLKVKRDPAMPTSLLPNSASITKCLANRPSAIHRVRFSTSLINTVGRLPLPTWSRPGKNPSILWCG